MYVEYRDACGIHMSPAHHHLALSLTNATLSDCIRSVNVLSRSNRDVRRRREDISECLLMNLIVIHCNGNGNVFLLAALTHTHTTLRLRLLSRTRDDVRDSGSARARSVHLPTPVRHERRRVLVRAREEVNRSLDSTVSLALTFVSPSFFLSPFSPPVLWTFVLLFLSCPLPACGICPRGNLSTNKKVPGRAEIS